MYSLSFRLPTLRKFMGPMECFMYFLKSALTCCLVKLFRLCLSTFTFFSC